MQHKSYVPKMQGIIFIRSAHLHSVPQVRTPLTHLHSVPQVHEHLPSSGAVRSIHDNNPVCHARRNRVEQVLFDPPVGKINALFDAR